MNQLTEAALTVMTAIVGVAILSVLVSRKSQTPAVFSAAGSAFANMLSAATGPVTGAVTAPNVGSMTGYGLGSPMMGNYG